MHSSPEGLRSCEKFVVLDNMSVLILLLSNAVTNWDWFQSSLPWLSLITGETVSLCHSANKRGKGRQIRVWHFKVKKYVGQIQALQNWWHNNHRGFTHLCIPSNHCVLRAEAGRMTYSPFPNMTILLTISQGDFFTGQTETLRYFSFILRKAAWRACRWQGEKHTGLAMWLVMWQKMNKPHLLWLGPQE